ncbi:MAG: hypothetical protein KDA24_20665 [Deltaproteobacteria bacterium]|nr:hypothetical protein [Deltaproteobacteria bacterium]
MVRFATVPAALVLCAAFSAPAFAGEVTWSQIKSASNWEHLADRDHDDAGVIKVYVAELSGTKCLKGTVVTPGNSETYLSVATDIVGSKKWSSAGLSESEVLAKSGDTLDYYQYLDVPGWTGASDRFWFLRGTKETAGATRTFWWNRMGDNGGPHAKRFGEVIAANPDAIEPPLNVGGWTFTQKDGNVESNYFVCSDTGGVLPKAIQYAAAKKTLPDTVGDLIREAKKR